ncbi:MAG: hypothetical protein GEV03_22600 [Streptosporangiales bacterium]|nr:hypothetical protein [Streptosporangiales bacterium]
MSGRVRDPRRRGRARMAGLASAALLLPLAVSLAVTPVAGPAGAATRSDDDRLPSVGSGLVVREHPNVEPLQQGIRDLELLMARIETAEPWVRVAKPAITEYRMDAARGVVLVGVERVTPRLTRAAARTFGDSVQLYQAKRYHRMSRGNDRAPHSAGAVLETDLGRCTSGFGVRRGGSTYFLGTAHCFRTVGERPTNNGRPYGRVAKRQMGNEGPDASLVASDFGPKVYVGGPDGNATRTLRGARTPAYGGRLCTSGANTGRNCAGERQQSDLCVRFGDGVTTCHLTRAVSADGSSLVQPGDSGGPVYTGRRYAVGIVVGGNSEGTELLYHPVGYLLDLWDARLLTAP